MTAASVQDRNTSVETDSGTTSHTVSLPSGISSGDLLLVYISIAVGDAVVTWPGGWTGLFYVQETRGGNNALGVAYRQATGSEGASISVSTDIGTRSAHISHRITGHADPSTQAPEYATDNSVNSSADPPSLTITGGPKDILWIAAGGSSHAGTYAAGSPTGFSDLTQSETGGAGSSVHAICGTAELAETSVSTKDPGAFDHDQSSVAEWVAATIAIHPATGGGNTGSLTATLADATLSSAGELAIEATATITLADAALAATAELAIGSTLTATLEDAALSAAGALALMASLGATLEDAGLSASGGVVVAASLTATLEDAELSAIGVLALAGAVTATLNDAELAVTGVLTVQAALTATLEDAGLSADAALVIEAALTTTLEDASLSATGTSGGLLASLTATLADATLSSTATLALSGTLTQILEAAGLSADAALVIEAALTTTLEDASLLATGIGPGTNTATLIATLEDAALSASGALALSSALSQTLEDANLAATGELAIAGALTATLSDAILSAVGSSMLIAAVTILRSRQRTNLLSAEARSNTLSARARSNVLITPDRGT